MARLKTHKLVEECGELIAAASALKTKPKYPVIRRKEFVRELADVQVQINLVVKKLSTKDKIRFEKQKKEKKRIFNLKKR